MRIINNENLGKYTTIKIGGYVNKMYFPQNYEELMSLLKDGKGDYILGGGSNLLIDDNKIFDSVVCLRDFNLNIESLGNGEYIVGAGVRLQSLINHINKDGYGGIEYLFSVPGLVGGAVCMNAGRGKKYNQTISDYIIEVTAVHNGKETILSKSECEFNHRTSIMKKTGDYIVTSVRMKFPIQDVETSKKLKEERLALCKERQDNSKPNFGSVFVDANSSIMRIVKRLGLRHKNVHFSTKTENWIIKEQGGTYQDALKVIKRVTWMHRIVGKKVHCEVVIWD